jgi:formylglycine-generating enzyme required for sulfatase activity
MKYEISQGQYAEFLNTIPSSAQTTRFLNSANNRNTITNTGTPPNIYVASRENRAANFLRWDDAAAYLDWACLRPMTEMEYEKACRGEAGVIAQEYAWGNTSITAATTISTTIPTEDGSEIILNPNANCNINNNALSGGDGGRGPLWVGVYALPTTSTRVASGATYYGILEMSGNVAEMVVPASVNASTFTRVWGDGALDATGNHNASTWPAAGNQAGTNGATNNRFAGYRGGSWEDNPIYARVSDRYYCVWPYDAAINSGTRLTGGRGVR